MDRKRWEQIDKVLDEALEREPAQRAALVAQACGGDEELRRAIEDLIAAHEQAGSFGERPAVEVAAPLMAEEPGPFAGREETGASRDHLADRAGRDGRGLPCS